MGLNRCSNFISDNGNLIAALEIGFLMSESIK